MSFVRDLIDKIFYGKHGEAMRYLFFGFLNVIVTWVSYAALVLVGIDINISNAASWVIGVAFAFVVNKLYVFNSRNMETKTVGHGRLAMEARSEAVKSNIAQEPGMSGP